MGRTDSDRDHHIGEKCNIFFDAVYYSVYSCLHDKGYARRREVHRNETEQVHFDLPAPIGPGCTGTIQEKRIPTYRFRTDVLTASKLIFMDNLYQAHPVIYLKQCQAFNTVLKTASGIPAYHPRPPEAFYDTQGLSQPGLEDLKIDMCLYPHTDQASMAYRVEDNASRACPALAWIELPVFVELDLERAPFNFDNNRLQYTGTDLGVGSRDRLLQCAGEIQLYQHRLFMFMIWIQRDWVRLMRWDRRALVVSSAFNYVEDPRSLVEFLSRFASASPTQRGHDPSVILATRPEIDMLIRYEPKNLWERAYHAEMIENLHIYPIRKVRGMCFPCVRERTI